jgi:hypothetical protein
MRVAYAACAHVGEQILKVLMGLQGRTVDHLNGLCFHMRGSLRRWLPDFQENPDPI